MGALGSLGSLNVLLSADTTSFTSAMSKAAFVAERDLQRIAYKGKMTIAAISAAIVASGTAIAVAVKKSIDHADQIAEMSQAIGLTAEQLSSLEYAAKLSGLGIDDLSTAFRKFNKMVYDGAKGVKSSEDAFKSLGITLTDNNGNLKNNYDLFLDSAEALSKLSDGAQKSAMAQELFGKSGASLLPLLNGGKEGIKKFAEEAEKLGVVISGKMATSADAFNDNMTRLAATTQGLVTQFTAGMLPSLEQLSTYATKSTLQMDAFREAGEYAGKSLIGLVAILQAVTSGYRMFLLLREGSLKKAMDLGKQFAEDQKKMWDAVSNANQEGSKKTKQDLQAATDATNTFNKAKDDGAKLTESLRSATEIYNDEMTQYNDLLKAGAISEETFERAAAKAKDTLDKSTESTQRLKKAADGIGQAFGTAFEDALIEGKKFRDVMMSLLQDIERALIRSLITDQITGAISSGLSSWLGGGGAAATKTPVKSAHGNIFQNGNLMPFASGGLITRPTLFPMENGGTGLAGEAGTEAIMPLFRGSNGDLGVKGGGGGGVEINVYAPPGSKVSQNQKTMGNKDQINIMIDEAVAGSVNDPGSKTHRSLKNAFGLRQSLTTR